jgi:tRNA(Ile)-lysidine synthase
MRSDEMLDLARLGPRPPDLRPSPRALRLARPLLRVARTTTLAYCAELGLPIVEDASNQSRAYTRNRVRLDLLPALERFNPAVREVLARTADLAAEDVAALDTIVATLDAGLVVPDARPGTLAYDRAQWRAQPRAIQRRLLRGALAALVGDLVDVGAAPIDDALDLLRSGRPPQAYHLPYGVELQIESAVFILQRHGRAMPRQQRPKSWGVEVSRV